MRKNPLYGGMEQLVRRSGRPGVRADEAGRDAFRKDYARLLHAPAFRRLQGKTQLFPGAESDYFRNRLTHSLEVAQIARGIAARLNATSVPDAFEGGCINEDLVEFASIAHDLGHPPFGHNGEQALDELMREYGGFEGNAQTLRILASVERKLVRTDEGSTSSDFGLDLTYRSLASVLKYDKLIDPERTQQAKLAKGYYATEAQLVAEVKRRVAPGLGKDQPFKTIECAIMDIADDIAYSTYDLEDSLHAGFVTPLSLARSLVHDRPVQSEVLDKTNKAMLRAGHDRVGSISELVLVLVEVFAFGLSPTLKKHLVGKKDPSLSDLDVLKINLAPWAADRKLAADSSARTRFTAERVGNLIKAVVLVPNEEHPQLSGVSMSRSAMLQVEVLKHLNYELVIRSPRLAVVEHRGKELVSRIFTMLCDSDGALLPDGWRARHAAAAAGGIGQARRSICDYVAGMTDRYAAELHARLYGEGTSIFKPL